MNSIRTSVFLTACGLCWIASASAQAPAPANGSATSPGAASTEEQRGVLRNGTSNGDQAEAPANGSATGPSAASSPHQRDVTSGSTQGGGISARSFVSKASQDGMTEVKLAELASQKSQNDSVKQFASHMASDHSTANSELENVAKEANIPVADKLDAKHQAEVDTLSKKSGAAFDKAYTAAMVKAHKQAVALFKKGAHSSDQNVASFANKTLPTLESHQRMANDLASQMRVASAGNDNTKR
jgi:putative membrane protein